MTGWLGSCTLNLSSNVLSLAGVWKRFQLNSQNCVGEKIVTIQKLNWELRGIEFTQALNFLLQHLCSLPNSCVHSQLLPSSSCLSVCLSVRSSVCIWCGHPGSRVSQASLAAAWHWAACQTQVPFVEQQHTGPRRGLTYTKECLDGSVTQPHTPLLCLFDSTNVIWHLNWVREVPVVLWAQTVDGDSSRELLHYSGPAQATEAIRNNMCLCHDDGVFGVKAPTKKLIFYLLLMEDVFFECVTRSLPQLHVCSCVSVCALLCCVWAVKHPSQQVSIISTSERWTACGFFVCASVWVPALKLPLSVQRKKTLPGGRLTSDSQRCHSLRDSEQQV